MKRLPLLFICLSLALGLHAADPSVLLSAAVPASIVLERGEGDFALSGLDPGSQLLISLPSAVLESGFRLEDMLSSSVLASGKAAMAAAIAAMRLAAFSPLSAEGSISLEAEEEGDGMLKVSAEYDEAAIHFRSASGEGQASIDGSIEVEVRFFVEPLAIISVHAGDITISGDASASGKEAAIVLSLDEAALDEHLRSIGMSREELRGLTVDDAGAVQYLAEHDALDLIDAISLFSMLEDGSSLDRIDAVLRFMKPSFIVDGMALDSEAFARRAKSILSIAKPLS